MTPEALTDYLARLELSQIGLAKLLGVDVRTVRRWELGEIPVPDPVIRLLWLLERVPGAIVLLRDNWTRVA